MPVRPGQRVYQSGTFEVIGLVGQLLVALPNLDLFAGAAALWLRVAGLGLTTLYVCVLLLRGFLPDRVLESAAQPHGGIAALQTRLRAGNRRTVVPVTLAAVLVAGFSLFGAAALGLTGDSDPPAAPGHLRSTGATAQQVDLAWDPVADGGGAVREYRVMRRDNGLERTSTSTTFHDTLGIGGGVRYDYRVVAVDGAGNVSGPSEVSVTTPISDAAACASDTTPPSQPGAPHATVVTATAVTLEWGVAIDAGNCGLAGYQLLRDGLDTGIVSAGSQVSEDGLVPDHSYAYTVVARDNAGNLSPASVPVMVATLARPVQTQSPCELGPPQALNTTGQTTTTVALTWSPPDQDCHLDGYRVYRGGGYVGQTAGTTFTVSGLAPATSYVFTVRAHNSDGEMSPSSNQVSATTATAPPPPAPSNPGTPAPSPDTTPPSAPGTPTMLGWAPTTRTLTVSWTAASDAESGINHYELYLNGIHAAGPVTGLTYAFANLDPHSTYTVGVAAVNNVGLQSSIVDSAPMVTGRGPGGFTMSMSPASVTLGVGGTVGISGGNAIPNTRVDIAIDSWFVVTTQTGADGTYAASFVVQPDGTVSGSPDSTTLVAGSYQVTVSTPECGCGDPPRSATLTIEPE
jgi:chitodextrinase